MAKPNYSFQKRQRELAKKKKKEEKSQRRLAKTPVRGDATAAPLHDAPATAGVPTENI